MVKSTYRLIDPKELQSYPSCSQPFLTRVSGLAVSPEYARQRPYAVAVAQVPEADKRSDYWNSMYKSRGVSGVSWYQQTPVISSALINLLGAYRDKAIVDIGGGASTLVDELARQGFKDLTVLDVSDTALSDARERLGSSGDVSWLNVDVLLWRPERHYALWHDRAVFHFLIEDSDRLTYLDLLWSTLDEDGSLVMGTFAEDGPEYCSGLPVARYSAIELTDLLRGRFDVIDARREIHTTPTGVQQPFTWVAARRRN